MTTETCSLCGLPTATRDYNNKITCRRCGEYGLTHQTKDEIPSCPVKDQLYLLSGLIRHMTENRQPPLFITEEWIEGKQPFQDRVVSLVPTGMENKADAILDYFVKYSKFPGFKVGYNSSLDYPIGYCKNEDEFSYYLEHLKELGLITLTPFTDKLAKAIIPPAITVTFKGWEQYHNLRSPNLNSSQAFVAMSFDENLAPVYTEGIAPLERETGYKMLRIDYKEFNEDIVNQIQTEIRRSRFLIADVTKHSKGVYFEAGFAMGLGMEVIWMCKEDDFDKAHFDTNHYKYILWKEPSDLKEKLLNRILGTIGESPAKRIK